VAERKKKTALVTGANRGIGQALAEALLAAGPVAPGAPAPARSRSVAGEADDAR
jgi:NAD(P)-dependent dehydrogenase (short-subunit alcohol dehydrogenase family)